jgi:hypothetical protein
MASVEYRLTVVATPAGNMKAARKTATNERRRNIPYPRLTRFGVA